MKGKVSFLKCSDVANLKMRLYQHIVKLGFLSDSLLNNNFLVNYYFPCGHFLRLSHTVCTADMVQSFLYSWSCLSSRLTWLSILISVLLKTMHLLLKIVWLVFSWKPVEFSTSYLDLSISRATIFERFIISILNSFSYKTIMNVLHYSQILIW